MDLRVFPGQLASPVPGFKERRVWKDPGGQQERGDPQVRVSQDLRATKGSRAKSGPQESEEPENQERRVNPGQQEWGDYQDFQEKTGLLGRRVNLAQLVFGAQRDLLGSAPRVKRETKASEGSEVWPVLLVSLDPLDQRVNQESLDGLDYRDSLAVVLLDQRGTLDRRALLVLLEKLGMDTRVPRVCVFKPGVLYLFRALLDYRGSLASKGRKEATLEDQGLQDPSVPRDRAFRDQRGTAVQRGKRGMKGIKGELGDSGVPGESGRPGVKGEAALRLEVRLQFNLVRYATKQDVKQAIRTIPYMGEGTYTGTAIRKATQEAFYSSRTGVSKVAIVITDGQTDKREPVKLDLAVARGARRQHRDVRVGDRQQL
ncbi:hypothetical protein CRUP_024773 [Coryphaenoides rupestris]|nr:hypothetical protein CRUP_024773 [Coryphaenoides rupestris]